MCIATAAIVGYDGVVVTLPRPNRHHDIIHYMATVLKHPVPITGKQGFVTVNGNFFNRVDSKIIARSCNQIISNRPHKELFSEDLW